MTIRHTFLSCVIAGVASVLVGCDGGSGSRPVVQPPPPPPVSFTQFVKDQFAMTADDTDPIEVDEMEFSFDADDPGAFDDLLANP